MTAAHSATNPLLQGDIEPTLRQLTLPVLAGMLTLMSFNLVDTFFISMLGTQQLAAVSFTFPVTFSVISLVIGLSIGTSAVIARALGAGRQHDARHDGLTAIWLGTLLVALLALLCYLLLDPMFVLLGADANILHYIRQYMLIWLAGSVLLAIPMLGNAILRAAGETKLPSIIMASGGLVNALLDPLLIFGWGPIPAMGMQGAALASVVAWLSSCGLIIYLLVWRRQLVSCRWLSVTEFVNRSRKILRIGLPAAGANMLTPLAMAVITAIMATYGAEAVAAFGVGMRIESIVCLVVLALSMTLPPFISQNMGAAQLSRVQQAYKLCCRFVLRWQLLLYVLLAMLAWPLADIFTDNPQVASYIRWFIWVMPLAYGLQGVIILTNSSFNAMHLPAKAVWLSIFRLFICYVPLAWLGGVLFGVMGVFIGCVLANVLIASVAYRWFNRVMQSHMAAPAVTEQESRLI
ncbi:MATE family efflux transporter [Arsukibacterium sp.]|uniref:MATE family efflux transporter n=1 Tax=Arsukibacterium sp. TaxID=1977258 RepID=UPI002FDABD4F